MSVKIIQQKAYLTDNYTQDAGTAIEHIARVCYDSCGDMVIDKEANDAFLNKLISRGHHSPFEHASATLYIITNRAIANELTRHRHASYMQESTRYVRYDELEIIPANREIADRMAIEAIESMYLLDIERGTPPQIARDVLPLCTATRMYMTANLRAWREILIQRLAPACHPQMIELAKMILEAVRPVLPVYFEGIE